jgi:hypothetical protein
MTAVPLKPGQRKDMETVVVTRHQNLLKYLKEICLVTGNEIVITGNATPDDVRGKHVIGVLPNFLAAEAACLTEVPLRIPQELRGRELSIEEIREFAGEPTSYKVAVVATPQAYGRPLEWTWNDGRGNRGRCPRCFVVSPVGEVFRFTGQDIPDLVKVLGCDYEKCGKWSNSTYRCLSPSGATPISWRQDWDTGETFPQDSWEEAFEWIEEQAPQAQFDSFEGVVRAEFPTAAQKFDDNNAAKTAFS